MGAEAGTWLVPDEYSPVEPAGPMGMSIGPMSANATSSGEIPARRPCPAFQPSRQSPQTPCRAPAFLPGAAARSSAQAQSASMAHWVHPPLTQQENRCSETSVALARASEAIARPRSGMAALASTAASGFAGADTGASVIDFAETPFTV